VLRVLADAVGLDDGATRLQRTPTAIDRTNVHQFFATLHDAQRRLPMIVFSPPYALDASELARNVFGAAHVVLLDAMSTWRLGELGPNWRVFDGAVRIFGPHFRADDRPDEHPRWLGRTIEGINHRAARTQEADFAAILARHVFATTAAAAGEIPVLNVDAIGLRQFARQRELHAAIETTDIAHERPPNGQPEAAAAAHDVPLEQNHGPAPVVDPVAQKLALIQDDMASLEAALGRKDLEIVELRTALFESRRHADELERAYLEIERAYIDLSDNSTTDATLSGLRALANDVPNAAPLIGAIEGMLAQTHELIAQTRDLDRRAQEHEDALRVARARNAWLEQRVSQPHTATRPTLPDYDDPEGLAAFVASRYQGRIVLHPRALARWAEGRYADRTHLLAALDLLGTDYHAMRLRRADDPAPRQRYLHTLAELGLRDGGPISDSAFGSFRTHYEVEWHGQPVRITDHLRNNGNSHDPARCLAIYFFWDETISASVICAMPGHLPNGLS
jgi:hypothetical protein